MRKSKYVQSILFILFFFYGCTIQHSIHFEDVSIQATQVTKRKLVDAFSKYWHYRINGQLKQSYRYELPYQRYTTDFKEYKALIVPYGKNTKIVLRKIETTTPNTAIITREVRTGKNVFYGKDKWILVNGRWYHKFFQNVFPPQTEEEAKFQ